MLPIRTSSIFRSRWLALLWAGGIIWSAVEFAGTAPHGAPADNAALTDASGATVDAEQAKQADQLLKQFGR